MSMAVETLSPVKTHQLYIQLPPFNSVITPNRCYASGHVKNPPTELFLSLHAIITTTKLKSRPTDIDGSGDVIASQHPHFDASLEQILEGGGDTFL